MGVTALGAMVMGEWSQAGHLLVDICVTTFLGGALMISTYGRLERLDRKHTIWLLVLLWMVVPVAAAQPFLSDPQMRGFTAAVFEAVSGLTTTGASVVGDLERMPDTLVVWRAILQWFGGAISIVTAVLVLAPFGVLSAPINITIPGYEKENLAKSIVATSSHILPAYVLLTLACGLLLWLAGLTVFDAICLAFATVSTGGFVPVNDGIHAYGSVTVEIILIVFMIAGATSFLSHRAVLLRVPGGHVDNRESWYLAILIAVCAVVLIAVAGVSGDAADIRRGIFRAVSLITTTGFDNAAPGAAVIPFVLVCAACAIGGASFSTAGGLKIFRMVSMLNQGHRELKRLIHPRSVTRAQSAGKPIDIQLMKTVWSLFFVFIFTIAVVAVTLGVEGVTFDAAVMAAVAAVSNTGPAVTMASYDLGASFDFSYLALSDPAKWALICAMILGRVEFVVALSLAYMLFIRR